jgi:hypothetical protein
VNAPHSRRSQVYGIGAFCLEEGPRLPLIRQIELGASLQEKLTGLHTRFPQAADDRRAHHAAVSGNKDPIDAIG